MDSKVKFKDLLEIAIEELKELTKVENPDFRLEQAEFNNKNKEWEIVVSFLIDNSFGHLGAHRLSGLNIQRVYKKLRINSERQILGFYIFEN